MATRLLIAGGGTGGHLFPGVAVAEALVAREPGAAVRFVGTARGIEARVVPELGWELSLIDVSGLKTVGLAGKLLGAARLPRALWQSERAVRAFRPTVVLGVGGYASGPVLLAARVMGLPTAIVEQNSVPGLTNKLLGGLVDAVFLAFEETRRYFAADKIHMVGCPIRADIVRAIQGARGGAGDGPLHVLVFGGSQGARALNRLVPDAIARMPQRPTVVHQTGPRELDDTRARYAELGVDADCRAFIDDMATEYARADVAVCRAGAATVAELAVAGLPALLIPFPYAADDHQTVNARELQRAGAARVLPERDMDADKLAELLDSLAKDRSALERMRNAMNALGRPDAAQHVVDWCQARGR